MEVTQYAGVEAMTGTLYGLGIGPGDPDLITLKARDILARAPVIAYPAPEGGESLVRAIAAPHVPAGRIEIAIATPMAVDRYPAARGLRPLRGHPRRASGGADATSPCCARATRSSTARSCTSTSGWRRAPDGGRARRLVAERGRGRGRRAAGLAQRGADACCRRRLPRRSWRRGSPAPTPRRS